MHSLTHALFMLTLMAPFWVMTSALGMEPHISNKYSDNQLADQEGNQILKRQEGTSTVFAPGYVSATEYTIGPTFFSTLSPGQESISFGASVGCQGSLCIGTVDGFTTFTQTLGAGSSTMTSAADPEDITSTSAVSIGHTDTEVATSDLPATTGISTENTASQSITFSPSAQPTSSNSNKSPRLYMSILTLPVLLSMSLLGFILF